jgi:hypothetical protein
MHHQTYADFVYAYVYFHIIQSYSYILVKRMLQLFF